MRYARNVFTIVAGASVSCLFYLQFQTPESAWRQQSSSGPVLEAEGKNKSSSPERTASSGQQMVETYGKLPLVFEANRGQTDKEVRFLARGAGYTVFFTPSEVVFSLQKSIARGAPQKATSIENLARTPQSQPEKLAVLRMKFVGAKNQSKITGVGKQSGKVNYFIGNDPKRWRTNIPTHAKVKYEEIYPGIDLIYYGNQRELEYDFVVAPGADPSAIQLEFTGAEKVELASEGDLILHATGGQVLQRKPLVYQRVDGLREEISGGYVIKGKNQVSFELGDYDAGQPLVIDPVLVYSTYLGGSGIDEGQGIAVDALGNAYLTGLTTSTNFPIANPLQTTYGGGFVDAFVAKLNPAGSALLYSTYLGSGGWDGGFGIAVDALGNAFLIGFTTSTNFPIANPLQATHGGGVFDALVAKITDTAADVAITFVGSNLPLPNPNAPLQVVATVANTGSVDVASVDVRIFLDLNSNLLLDVGEPFALTTVTNLLVGTSQNVAGVFQCPPPGSYLGVAKADPLNLLAETNEGNNVGSTPVNMTLADLTVTGLSSSSTLMNNGNFQVTLQATIANIGPSPASNVQVRFAFSSNGGVSFTNIAGPVSAGTIPVGGTGTGTRVWNNVAAGAYLIRVTVDPNNLICESNEGNNVSTFNISVL